VTAVVRFVGGAKLASMGTALGLGGGFLLGNWLRGTLTLAPGASSWNRLPWIALAALAVGVAVRLPRTPLSVWLLLRASLAAAAAWWVVPAEVWLETPWLPATFGAVILAEWVLLEFLAAKPPGGSVPWMLAMTAFCAAAILIHAGTARLMDVATVLGAALFGVGAATWWQQSESGGAVSGAVLVLPGILLMGQQETFSEVPWTAFAFAACAPLTLALTLLPPIRLWPGWKIGLCRFALVLVPVAVAVLLAVQAGPLEFE
jgi:hypothetical protein